MESRGVFVVLEGGDGCGKSTQAELLVARVRQAGRDVVRTREPGSTEAGAAIRTLVLGGGDLDPRAEALLIAADRAEHVAEVIRPALARGAVVVSDRYVPSSLAYQGVAHSDSRATSSTPSPRATPW
jgi:dTMP kinase